MAEAAQREMDVLAVAAHELGTSRGAVYERRGPLVFFRTDRSAAARAVEAQRRALSAAAAAAKGAKAAAPK